MVRASLASIDSLMSGSAEPWKRTFDFFDLEGKGTLSVDDFQKCLQSFGQKVSKEQVRHLLRDATLNADGELEFDEFVRIMEDDNSRKISMGALRRYFETLDKDGSGSLTAAELRHVYTTLGHTLTDRQMDMIIDRYDLSGHGELGFDEFVDFVKDGHKIDIDPTEDYHREVPDLSQLDAFLGAPAVPMPTPSPRSAWARSPASKAEYVDLKDKKLLASLLKPLAGHDGKIKRTDLESAVDLWTKHRNVPVKPEDDPSLHWSKDRPKVGLGQVIHKTNHISIVVSDVGRSAAFYANVVGLQQIRRPDFDRHGAWFTMGNLELHLIKGNPVVHPGTDLIVGHIAIETTDIDQVPEILTRAGVPFRKNVSVPKGVMDAGLGTNSESNNQMIVKQYFLRDPDGYWLEICDCSVLTKYCLGDIHELTGYDQGISEHLAETAMFVNLAERLAHRASREQQKLAALCSELRHKPLSDIARRLGCISRADEVDEDKLRRLIVRRTVYGDICQNESEASLKEILLWANNHIPTAMKIMQIRGWEGAVIRPPVYWEAGAQKVVPEAFMMPAYSIAHV